jgi:hypothetical protein
VATGGLFQPGRTNMTTLTHRECAYAMFAGPLGQNSLERFEGSCAFKGHNDELGSHKPHNIW